MPMKKVLPASVVMLLLCLPLSAAAQAEPPPAETGEAFFTATVLSTEDRPEQERGGETSVTQSVRLRLTSGKEAGKEVDVENTVLNGREDMRLEAGDAVAVDRQTKTDGTVDYVLAGRYRLPAMLWLTLVFVALCVLVGGLTGLTSLAGLAVSVAILVLFVVPRILAGGDPLAVCLIGTFGIACTSLYLAHGFNKRTSVALLSTAVTLAFSGAIAVLSVSASRLFGMGSEESLFLQSGLFQGVDLRGLLLGGIIIGCLGVLDDVTTAQTAAIDEISKANPALTATQLRAAGKSVGKEHIASLINTLALAYAGASLPMLLLLNAQDAYPLWMTVNSELFAEEIIRTLVGSAALLIAVPVSTWSAAFFLRGGGDAAAVRAG